MNHTYKMKYASYLETLTQEQRSAELISSVSKGLKRAAGKKQDEKVNILFFVIIPLLNLICNVIIL